MTIESDIEKKFEEAIKKFSSGNDEKRLSGFHVSSMSYDCKRNIWYNIKLQSGKENSIDGIYRMWIGSKLHETPITENHELKMKTKRNSYILSGTLDEIVEIDGKKYLIDKKFQQYLPMKMLEHHRIQVMYYAVLLKDLKDIDVDGVGIVYFPPYMKQQTDKAGNPIPRMKVVVAQVTPQILEEYRKKLYDFVDETSDKLKKNELPDKNASWYCQYCPYKEMCDIDSKGD